MATLLREPARLLHNDSTDELTRTLLRSADVDNPPARSLSRAMVRVTSLLADDRNLALVRIREPVPSRRRRLGGPENLRFTRAAAFGLLLGTSLAAAVVGVTQTAMRADRPSATLDTNPTPTVSTRRAARTVAAIRELPAVATAPSATNSSQPAEAKPVRPAVNDLGQELALLDSAKAALSAGNARGALGALDTAARLPKRVLVPEATVLRVRALVALKRTTEARRLVEGFVKQAPHSPVAPVLREIVSPYE